MLFKFLFSAIFFIPFLSAEELLTFEGTEKFSHFTQCNEPSVLSCQQVSVNFDVLLNAQELTLPHQLILQKSKDRKTQSSRHLSFKNHEDHIEAIFVYGEESGNKWMSASINWNKEGRHFRITMCGNQPGCYLWSEIDTKSWRDNTKPDLEIEENLYTNEKQQLLLKKGREDDASIAEVSVTVHVTDGFRESFDYDEVAIKGFVYLAIAESNEGYENSNVPIFLFLHCIVNSEVLDDVDLHVMIDDFKDSASGDVNYLRRGADIAYLLTAIDAEVCGVGKVNAIASGNTLAVAKKSCAVGYFSFGHEIGHMYGCYHNREVASINDDFPEAYGFLMRPPVESGYRTILAYKETGYSTRVNFYSGLNINYEGVPSGDRENNNAELLIERRFQMGDVGIEELTCDA